MAALKTWLGVAVCAQAGKVACKRLRRSEPSRGYCLDGGTYRGDQESSDEGCGNQEGCCQEGNQEVVQEEMLTEI
jgi:hypothetical protein